MKLYELLRLLEPGMSFAINVENELRKYFDVDELYQDAVFYEYVKDTEVLTIWHSKTLYGCIVINVW